LQCRAFTPQLSALYEETRKARDLQQTVRRCLTPRRCMQAGKALQIVFVSSDRDEAAFSEYHAEMSFLALPFVERERKTSLSKEHKVNGIPTLVLLDGATGEVISKDGRGAVSSDPQGFPWRPKPLGELLGTDFVDSAGAPASLPADTTHVALYFSAHWCPPCRRFTPQLAARAGELRDSGAKLAIVFVSGDEDEDKMKAYHSEEMPAFLAVPFADEKRREALNSACGVNGIPSLLLCSAPGPDLAILNPSARGCIARDFPDGWLPHAVPDVNDDDSAVEALNTCATLICLAEGLAPEAAAAARATLAALRPEVSKEKLFLAIALEAGNISTSVRKLCRLGEPTPEPQLVLLDLSDDGAFYVPQLTAAGEVACDGDSCSLVRGGMLSEADLKAAVAAWQAGALPKQQAKPDESDEAKSDEEDEDEGEGEGEEEAL